METERELYELEFPQDKSVWLGFLQGKYFKEKNHFYENSNMSFLELLHHFTWVLKILGSFTNPTEEVKFFQM